MRNGYGTFVTDPPGGNLNASFITETQVCDHWRWVTYQAVWDSTDADNGTLALEYSVDGQNWDEYPDGTYTFSGVTGIFTATVQDTPAFYWRWNYKHNVGTTGNVTITWNAKGE
jgi:hypothetical protein